MAIIVIVFQCNGGQKMNYNRSLENKAQIPPFGPMVRENRRYLEYLLSDARSDSDQLQQRPTLKRNKQLQIRAAAEAVRPVPANAVISHTQFAASALSLDLEGDEPAIFSSFADADELSLIDDLDPVPDFIHHPTWAIWLRPRHTFHYLVNQLPLATRMIAATSGLALVSRIISMFPLLDSHPIAIPAQSWIVNFLIYLLAALIIGPALWKLETIVSTYLGKLIGGYANQEAVGHAIFWANLPAALCLLFHAVGLIMFGATYWQGQIKLPLAMEVLGYGLHIYSLVFSMILLSEAHKFSIFRAIVLRLSAGLLAFAMPLAGISWLIQNYISL